MKKPLQGRNKFRHSKQKNVIFVGRKNKATLWKKGDIIDDTSFWNLSFEPSGIVNEIASANHF